MLEGALPVHLGAPETAEKGQARGGEAWNRTDSWLASYGATGQSVGHVRKGACCCS